jgi:cell division protein ZapA (FtsZ GTPase activity inhibitor)
MSNELITINLVIGDRTYRIKVAASDEEKVRAIIKNVNDKLIEFKTQFAGKDMQDYIAMVLIWLSTTLHGNQPIATENMLEEELRKLDAMLDLP